MNKIEKSKYVSKKYPRKAGEGVMFLFIWGIGFLCAVVVMCIYLWVSQ